MYYLQDLLETKVDFRQLPTDSSGQYRIQVNFLPSAIQPVKGQHDVTLVTHCTSNHLHYLLDLTKHWKGPISLGVFCCSFVIYMYYLKSQCFIIGSKFLLENFHSRIYVWRKIKSDSKSMHRYSFLEMISKAKATHAKSSLLLWTAFFFGTNIKYALCMPIYPYAKIVISVSYYFDQWFG